MNLSRRRRQPELMDQPGLDLSEHAAALDGLRRINRWSRSSEILWMAIQPLAMESSRRPLSVLDVACGGGDVAIGVAKSARRAGLELDIHGCDVSNSALSIARQRTKAEGLNNVFFFQLDVLREPFPCAYDVVMCSLFLHHLSKQDSVRLLSKMAGAARSLVLVNDLRRSGGAYYLAWLGCRLLTQSHVVRVDGPRSVAAAFTVEEVLGLAKEAGWRDASVSRRWPYRFLLRWRRA
jgi:SAM-dependent methyltransferase